MGYRIMYSPEEAHKYPKNKPAVNKWMVPAVAVSIVFATMMIPQLRSFAERWLIPGEAQITKAAFSVMIDDIKTGEPIDEAVSAFCHEILAHGKTEEIYHT